MFKIDLFHNKLIGIVGLGKTGLATAKALQSSPCEVIYYDDNPQNSGNLNITPQNSDKWAKCEYIIAAPGIPLSHPLLNLGNKIIGEVELLTMQKPDAKLIGITGTNGKSTTTALCEHILRKCGIKAQAGANLGTPALALAEDNDYFVLEMSSFQLDLCHNTRFKVAALLNITKDHLDRHGSMENYINAKTKIFANQSDDDVRIICVDDEYTAEIAEKFDNAILLQAGKDYEKGRIFSYDISGINSLQGLHNAQNAAVAMKIAEGIGLKADDIYQAMQSFAGLPHRMEFVLEKNGVKYINDSKATNADATEKALRAFDEIYWLAGGIAKEGGIEPLKPLFNKIKKAYLFGKDKEIFAKTLRDEKVEYAIFDNMQDALNAASKNAQSGVILLSPAAASMDMFQNYEHRGNIFKELVLQKIS